MSATDKFTINPLHQLVDIMEEGSSGFSNNEQLMHGGDKFEDHIPEAISDDDERDK